MTFFAPPTSAAGDLLAAEPRVAATVYFTHAGSELQRGIILIRLVALLRRQRLKSIWILDRTIRPALAAALAGIPERIGLGLGTQSAFISTDGIGQDHFHDHPIDWLRALMAAMNVPLSSTEPDLQVPTTVLSSVGEKFAPFARPWIAIGIGASHPDKHWQDAGHPAVAQRGIHGADGIERFLLRRVGRFLYGSHHLGRLGGLGSGPVCRASIVGRDDGQAQILADRRRHIRMKGGTVGRSKRCTARAPAAAC